MDQRKPQEPLSAKPFTKEDEYFLRLELERQREAEIRRAERESAEEKERLKELHFMRCPKCGHELLEEDYQGVKIDRCALCRGIWLDPGELEQLAEASRKKEGFLKNLLSVLR